MVSSRRYFGKPLLILNLYFAILLAVSSRDIGDTKLNFLPSERTYYARRNKLYNYCSGKDIEIVDNKVTARGHMHSNDTFLLFRNVEDDFLANGKVVAFYILADNMYICFNRKSKLIARVNGEKNRRCVFEEVFSTGENCTPPFYTGFRSVVNDKWYIGFDRKGRPLLGSNYSKNPNKRKCYYFIKRDLDYGLSLLHEDGPKIKHAKIVHLLRNEKSHRERRSLISS